MEYVAKPGALPPWWRWTWPFPPRTKVVVLISFLAISILLVNLHLPDGLLTLFKQRRAKAVGSWAEISLPPNLEGLTIARFDELVRQGEIFYEPSEAEMVLHNGFQFEFRILPFLKRKPISTPDSPSRSQPGGPFINPRPEEIITDVGPSHRLLFNKYCAYRPMLLLPTTEYALQTDDLDEYDLAAAWAVLKAFKPPQVVAYNCGVNAGSSQGHKHIQIFPTPKHKLWPSSATSTDVITSNITDVPFRHFVLRIPEYATVADVVQRYRRLLQETEKVLRAAHQGSDYNVVLVSEWIALIPRSKAEWGGPFGANALGMLGLVAVRDQEERDVWGKFGYTDHLRSLGIALST